VPAILSPERQYRELYRSRLDYIEARSSADVLAAIERLQADPTFYSDMVQNGLVRAREFQADRLVQRWVEVLWGEIPRRTDSRTYRLLAKARRYRTLALRSIR
jgi:hypothetical protein